MIPGMKPHGEGWYDAAEASGGLRGDALAQDLSLGGEDGGRRVVAARLDAEDEAAANLIPVAALSLSSTLMTGKSASSMSQEAIW